MYFYNILRASVISPMVTSSCKVTFTLVLHLPSNSQTGLLIKFLALKSKLSNAKLDPKRQFLGRYTFFRSSDLTGKRKTNLKLTKWIAAPIDTAPRTWAVMLHSNMGQEGGGETVLLCWLSAGSPNWNLYILSSLKGCKRLFAFYTSNW